MPSESDVLAALQAGLPLSKRPFADLARSLGLSEDDLIDRIAVLRRRGLVRRFGAVFDVRRLGYRSALCCAVIPTDEIDAVADKITSLPGVTHCYLREIDYSYRKFTDIPNLWFTLSYPADVFAAMADEVAARLKPYVVHVLPATRRYKIDVVFGGKTRARDEDPTDDLPPVTGRDRAIIRALQGDTEVRADYFAALAESVGMTEWDFLSTLEMWSRSGRLKRIGLLLAHRKAGYAANGMCCWKVSGDTTEAGRALAARAEVTHCYERPAAPGFDRNLYAMIHARTREAARAQFAALEEGCGLGGGVMLVSAKEYKKTSMTFFV